MVPCRWRTSSPSLGSGVAAVLCRRLSAAGDSRPEGGRMAKTMMVYFSCTGTTKHMAGQIADELGVDATFEIKPAEPYTEADLNWRDEGSRTTAERDDKAARPALAEDAPDLSEYDTVLLGFPIWWMTVPRIVATFIESVDLSGKTVVPFCTSGGGDKGTIDADLPALAEAGEWKPGKVVNGMGRMTIDGWLKEVGLR